MAAGVVMRRRTVFKGGAGPSVAPAHFWRFEEAAGTNKVDVGAGSHVNLTPDGSITQETGKIGHAMGCVGTGHQATGGALAGINNSVFTLACWVYLPTISAISYEFVGWGVLASFIRFWLVYDSSGKFKIRSTDAGLTTTDLAATSFGSATAATWNCIACGYRTSPSNQIWISVNDGTKDVASVVGGPNITSQSIGVGGQTGVAGGWIDNLCVDPTAWSDANVTAFYNAGLGTEWNGSAWV